MTDIIYIVKTIKLKVGEMRVSKDEKAKTYRSIVKTASALMRQNGIAQTGVSDVMEGAGLTHGGFYRHFVTKDDLAIAAIKYAFDETLDTLDQHVAQKGAKAAVKWYAQRYLSKEHVNNAAAGCPVAAIGTEGAHLADDIKSIMGAGAERISQSVAKAMQTNSKKQSLQIMATMLGAVVFARSVGDHKLGQDVLAACTELVDDMLKANNTAS